MATRSSRSAKSRPVAERWLGGKGTSRRPAASGPASHASPGPRRPVPHVPAAPASAVRKPTARASEWHDEGLEEGRGNVLYGRNPVREALRGRRSVHEIIVMEGRAGDELLSSLRDWAFKAAVDLPPVRRLPEPGLAAWLRTDEHQGIAARVEPFPYLEPEALLSSHTLLVALDEVQDPHNLGAIIRTAEGAGAGVIIPRHRSAEITAAVVKASAGATEHAAVAQVRNLADFLGQAKAAGFWTYGTAASAPGSYSGQNYRYPTCFVMGSEGFGLGKRVGSLCDVMVNLPLVGEVESLNVSVTAGILLYEALRQRSA